MKERCAMLSYEATTVRFQYMFYSKLCTTYTYIVSSHHPNQFDPFKYSMSPPPPPLVLTSYESQIPTNQLISSSSLSLSYGSSSFFSMPNDGWLNYRSHYPLNLWPNHIMIRKQINQEVGMPMPIDAPSPVVTMEASGRSINAGITYSGNSTFLITFPLTLEVSGSWKEIEPKKNGQHLGLAKPTRNQRIQEGRERFAHHCYLPKSSSIFFSRDIAPYFTSDKPILPHIKQKLNIVLTKKLSSTDANVGRIVLPKWAVEDHLPYLRNKEGIHLIVRDIFSSDSWDMTFRFWLNNGDRMYHLGNAGSFIRKYNLECGDFIALYQDESKNFQYICCRKRNEPLPPSMIRGEVVHNNNQMVRQTNKHPEQEQSRGGSFSGNNTTNSPTITECCDPIVTEIRESSATRESLYMDAQVNINYCNFPEFDKFPDFNKYGLYAPIEMESSAPTITEIAESSSARNGLSIDTQLDKINDCSIPEFEEFPGFEEQRLSAPIVMESSATAMTEITEPSSGRNGLCIDTQVEFSNSCNLSEFKEFSEFFDEYGLSAPTMTEITEPSSARDGFHIDTQMEENNDCSLLEFKKLPGFDEYGPSAPSVMEGSDPYMTKTTESSSARDGINTDTQLENIKDCDVQETEEFPGFDEYGLSIYDLRPGDKDEIMLIRV